MAENKIDIVSSIRIDQITGVDKNDHAMGWIHTHGMDQLGYPELEIREVPLFMGRAAATIINGAADYMVNYGRVIKLGEKLQLEELCILEFAKLDPIPGSEHHYEVERWALVTPEFMRHQCSHPNHVDIDDVTMPN